MKALMTIASSIAFALITVTPVLASPDAKRAEGSGVVSEASHHELTLVGGLVLQITGNTRFVTRDGEEVPRSFLNLDPAPKRSRVRAPTGIGLGVVEYEGYGSGKRIRATRITPLFQEELQ